MKKMKKTNTGYDVTEKEADNWGYRLIKQNRMTEALEIFKLNVYLYPASANAFDSPGKFMQNLAIQKGCSKLCAIVEIKSG